MIVYRITMAKWADRLVASGNPARWNTAGRFVIYTANSRALACLENLVHRSGEGLQHLFKVLEIEIPDELAIQEITLDALPSAWSKYENYAISQEIGDIWLAQETTCLLKVPSAIIPQEYNYLINPQHPDFKRVKIPAITDFVFDTRLKM